MVVGLDKNKIFPLFDQAVVSGGNALIQVLLVRILGLDQYGVLAFIMIFILGAVALNQSIVILPFQVLFDSEKKEKDEIEINTFQLQIVIVLTVILGLFWLLNLSFSFLDNVLLISGSFYGLGYLLHDFVRKKLYVKEDYVKVIVLDVSVFLGSITIIGFGYFSNLNLINILVGLGSCLTFISMIFYGGFKLFHVNKELLKRHWDHAKWLAASTITQWFSGNIILSTAGVILGPWVLGVVRMGQTINGVLGVLFQLMESYFPSKISKVYKQDGFQPFKKYLINIGVKATLFTAGMALLLMVFRQPIMSIIYGEEGLKYSYIMFWFGTLLVVNVLNILMRFYIRTLNINRIIFESYLFLAFVSILGANFLIENWGLNGVCLGLVANQLLSLLWFFIRVFFNQRAEVSHSSNL